MKKNKRLLSLALALVLGLSLCACGGDTKTTPTPDPQNSTPVVENTTPVEPTAWEPTKPITIMNYVDSGGGMDVATRKFADLATKYTNATIIVDNKPGAGGLTAMDYVLDQPADGYLVFAGTISNIAYIVSNEEDTDHYVWGFEWIDNIMADPMAIIVNDDADFTLEDLIAESKQLGGSQLWVGPSTGGIKHVIGLKFWQNLGIEATWVPYESGPKAMAALLSRQGVASVGNPSDVNGRELKNLVIATHEKLANFPDVPNFADLGYPELDNVSMWRGFAVKKGTPPEMIAWWQDLCQKILEDDEWVQFFNEKSIAVKNETTEAFEAQIRIDIEDNMTILKSLDMISKDYNG